ncbi:hypothetical protein J3F84DRAFT_327105 [Trichoderma pleuroticola]
MYPIRSVELHSAITCSALQPLVDARRRQGISSTFYFHTQKSEEQEHLHLSRPSKTMAASSETNSSKPDQDQPEAAPEVDLAQALRELARGEQTATAMETNLTNLESKLDAILAAFDDMEREKGAKTMEKVDGEGKAAEK